MVCSRYPKECRYYEKVLKKKCLTKLKNHVWESKTKWKLLDKADDHHKCKVLSKYFNLWLAYVVERYKKEIDARSADLFYEQRLKARGILALKTNIEQNWMLMRICKKKCERNLKFRLWHQWKHYTQKRLKVKEIKLLANRIREERLRIRYIYLWSFRLNERRSQVDAFRKITEKHETRLMGKFFNSWKLFTNRKQFKKKIEILAITCYEDKLLEKCFFSWKKHFFRKKRYKSHVEIITNYYENHLLNNYLTAWWVIYKKVKLERKMTSYQSAHNFYTRKLLERSLRAFWKAKEARREMCEKMKTFRSRYQHIYITFYMSLMMTRRTEKILWNIYETKALKWRENWLAGWAFMKLVDKYTERMNENEEMSKIVKYSNSIMIHRAFRAWMEVTIRKLNKKLKAQNACEFHDEKLIQKAFKKWKVFAFRKFQKRMAIDHCRNTLLFKCTRQWRVFVEERKMRIKEAKNLERTHKIKLLRKAFTSWKNKLDIVKNKNTVAVVFCNKSRLSKAFYVWRTFAQKKIISKRRNNSNTMILNNIIIKNVLYRWNEICLQKQSVNKKLEKLHIKREKRLVTLCFVNWTKYVAKMKEVEEAVSCYPHMKKSLLMEAYFVLLLKALELKKVARRKEELARRTEEKLLKRKYLKKWISFVCWKKEKILRCISEERRKKTKQCFELAVTAGKGARRKPIIPDYLKSRIQTREFKGDENGGKQKGLSEIRQRNFTK